MQAGVAPAGRTAQRTSRWSVPGHRPRVTRWRSSRVSTEVTASRVPSPIPAPSIFGGYAPARKSICTPTLHRRERAPPLEMTPWQTPRDCRPARGQMSPRIAVVDRSAPRADRRASLRVLVNKSIYRERRRFSTIARTPSTILSGPTETKYTLIPK